MKIKLGIIKIGHIFQIIHTEFNNWRFRILKNKFIIEFNRKSTRMNESKYQNINIYLIKEKVWE